MDKKILQECLELYHNKPYPKWGKISATLRVHNVKTIAGRKWHGKSGEVLGLLLELEEALQTKAKKATPKKAKAKEE